MDNSRFTLLLIEDNPGDARLIRETLAEARAAALFNLVWAKSLAEGLEHLSQWPTDAVLLDLNLPDSSGIETFEKLHEHATHVAIILMTGLDNEDLALQAIHQGAQDYLVKGEVDSQLLERAIRYAIERKRVGETLREREEQHRFLLDNTSDFIARYDRHGMMTHGSGASLGFCGYRPEELVNISAFARIHPDDEKGLREEFARVIESGEEIRAQYRLKHKSCKYIWVEAVGRRMVTTSGEPEIILGQRDISARKRAEEALLASLDEKIVLLKEIHHRVKNNLQIVASLLGLQANRATDAQMIDMLRDTRNRVKAMALLHETLYRSGCLASINFTQYIRELCGHLMISHNLSGRRVRIEYDLAEIGLSLDQAIPCGLIVNELVSNALKHGFPGDHCGKILVGLKVTTDLDLMLCVEDLGVGLPAGLDPATTATLGLKLVAILSQQLRGTLEMGAAQPSGTLVRVIIPLLPHPDGSQELPSL